MGLFLLVVVLLSHMLDLDLGATGRLMRFLNFLCFIRVVKSKESLYEYFLVCKLILCFSPKGEEN